MDTLTLFSKNLNQRSLTPRWPLTPCLLRSHVWLYPRIIVSKSHDNTSMYVDTVINFAKYHIHTYAYIHTHTTYRMSDHIVSYWTQFRRDKKSLSTSVVSSTPSSCNPGSPYVTMLSTFAAGVALHWKLKLVSPTYVKLVKMVPILTITSR